MGGWLHAGHRPASEAIRNLLRRQLRHLRRRRTGGLPLKLALLTQNLLLVTCNLRELLRERGGVKWRPTRQQHTVPWMPMIMCHESCERESERPGQTLCPGHALSSLWIRGLHWFPLRHYGFVDAAPLACAAM
jgi:hypothetical protein